MTLALRALTRLASWPDLAEAPPNCGTGRALRSEQSEIVHLHTEQDVDLHLTVPAIRRLETYLRDETAVRVVPGSDWVTMRLEVDSDIDLLLTLVSAALHAHRTQPAPADTPSPGCNEHRGMALPRNGFGGN
ncbi:luciferase family protein [Streptomyces sp. NPDC050535]|uniref:luciferase domain-containing protein n=1 Tax=Streptomyces sp. NPDC050535 TaxID=3365626 RepID=UPI00379349F2